MTEYVVPIDIENHEIDFMGHVNNASYLKWVQDVVISHWKRFASIEMVSKYLWVAIKHEITYLKPAYLEDNVVADVTCERVFGARAFYKTIFSRGDQKLVEVISCWCCIDADSNRPTRIDRNSTDEFFRIFQDDVQRYQTMRSWGRKK